MPRMPKLQTLKPMPSKPEVEAARMALVNAMQPYADKLGAAGMLAVAAHLVGQLIAMQNQKTMTREMALSIVEQNIESGNQHVIAKLAQGASGKPN